MKHVTLLYLRRDNQILLGMKKLRFGAGKWNSIGGKADEGEKFEVLRYEFRIVKEIKGGDLRGTFE